MPNRMWNYTAVKRNRLLWGAWQGSELAPWDKEEFHLTRHPNTVFAVMLGKEGAASSSEIQSMGSSGPNAMSCFESISPTARGRFAARWTSRVPFS